MDAYIDLFEKTKTIPIAVEDVRLYACEKEHETSRILLEQTPVVHELLELAVKKRREWNTVI